MVAEKRDAGTNLSLRRIRRMEGGFGIKSGAGFWLERWRMNGASARWQAGTFFRDGCEAGLFTVEPLHPTHHAVMFAVPAAAWGKVRVGV